jgi:predicted nucleotidyltransferase
MSPLSGIERPGRVLARAAATLLLGTFVLTAPVTGADSVIRLTDVAADAGISLLNISGSPTKDLVMDANGNGAAWFDFDRDGDLDALIVNGSRFERLRQGGDLMAALYRNNGDGTFTDVTASSGLTRRGWGTGVCVADFDNDGHSDIYITAFGPNVLWRNTGRGTFTATGQAADTRWSTGCAFGDYDRDGLVDLYVANYVRFDARTVPTRESGTCTFLNIVTFCGPRPLPGEADVLYRNAGRGRFVDVSRAAGIVDPGYYGFGVVFTDLDDDGWPDIFVANDSVPNLFFRNRGNGTFEEQGVLSGLAVSSHGREQAAMGVGVGDLDEDGRLDLVQTNFAQDYTTVYHNDGEGLFRDGSLRAGTLATLGPNLGWGVGFVDVDNDGLLDLFIANGHVYPDVGKTGTSTYAQRNQLLMNAGQGRLRRVTNTTGGGLQIAKSSRGAAFGDYDNDGDTDVLIVNMDDRPTLLRNDSDGGHWITLRLIGTRSNRDGIGAKVTAQAGGRRRSSVVRSGGSYISHDDMRITFGLGTTASVDRLTIRWPSGQSDTVDGLAADRFYVAREGAGVSPDE